VDTIPTWLLVAAAAVVLLWFRARQAAAQLAAQASASGLGIASTPGALSYNPNAFPATPPAAVSAAVKTLADIPGVGARPRFVGVPPVVPPAFTGSPPSPAGAPPAGLNVIKAGSTGQAAVATRGDF
jgi:hypothetical protein